MGRGGGGGGGLWHGSRMENKGPDHGPRKI